MCGIAHRLWSVEDKSDVHVSNEFEVRHLNFNLLTISQSGPLLTSWH